MRQIFPTGTGRDAASELDDEALLALYQPPEQVPDGRGWLRVNFVTSVDGAVEVDGYTRGLGSAADKRVFGLLRGYPDALLVGAGTLRHEGYGPVRPTARSRDRRIGQGLAGYPRLVVVSGRLDLAPTHPALADAPVRPAILTRADAPPDRVTALSAVADVLAVGAGEVDLAAGLGMLRADGVRQVLCEGGPHLFGALAAADLVDEVCLTVAPLLAGPGPGRIIAGVGAAVRGLVLAHVLEEDGVLLLRYTRAV